MARVGETWMPMPSGSGRAVPAAIRALRSGSPAIGPRRGPVQSTTSAKLSTDVSGVCRGRHVTVDPVGVSILSSTRPATTRRRPSARAAAMRRAIDERAGDGDGCPPGTAWRRKRRRAAGGRLAQTWGTWGREASMRSAHTRPARASARSQRIRQERCVPKGMSAASSRSSPHRPWGCGSCPRRDRATIRPVWPGSRRPSAASIIPGPSRGSARLPMGPFAGPEAVRRGAGVRSRAPPPVRQPQSRCRGRSERRRCARPG